MILVHKMAAGAGLLDETQAQGILTDSYRIGYKLELIFKSSENINKGSRQMILTGLTEIE